MDVQNSKVAQLFFVSFVFLTDIRKNVTPTQIELLHDLMNDPAWCTSEFVRASIALLRERYTPLWEAYETGKIIVDADSLAHEIKAITSSVIAAEAIALTQDLSFFVDKFKQATTTSLSRFGLSTASNARIQRQREISHLLEEVGEKIGEKPQKSATAADTSLFSETPPWQTSRPATGTSHGEPAQAAVATIDAALESGSSGFLESWDGRVIKARCVAVVNETKDTHTYIFGCDTVGLFNYKPGQFVSMEIKVRDKVLRRCYTISSSPSRPRRLSITVKRLDRGWMSNWLAENMVAGVHATISGPFGEFHLERTTNRKLLMLAAGSGVTPIMSMLRWMADVGDGRDVIVINSVRSPSDVIYGREFRLLTSQLPSVRIVVLPSSIAGSNWVGVSGRISDAMLNVIVPDVLERDVLMCGPSEYMQCATDMLKRIGLPTSRIFSERFGAAETSTAAAEALPLSITAPVLASSSDSWGEAVSPRRSDDAPHLTAATADTPMPAKVDFVNKTADDWMVAEQSALIVFERSAVEVPCNGGALLLEAAQAAGIALDNACRSGVCGSCKLKKAAGEVRMPMGTALSESDIAEGYILSCVGRVYGRVVVDR